MKDILIIAHFTQVPGELTNGRFHYIADKIMKENMNIEVVTSSFSHKKKQQRKVSEEQLKNNSYKFTMLYEPDYKKNVSIKRFYSHYAIGNSLKKYLQERKKPDIIYCAVPSLDMAGVVAKYAIKNNIRFIIDVQDLWPEAFRMVFHVPVVSDLIFYPMERKANFIYSAADEIIAVSKTYANRALKVNAKCKNAHIVFLGTELANFDKLVEENKFEKKPDNEIWLTYVGTLGHSYDLTCVIDALKILVDKGIKNIKFIVMGDGPLKEKYENYAREKGIYYHFTGRLDYGKMVGILAVCDIAVNPITKGAAQSIINKHSDYAAAGLPVLNTQESEEYRNLVDEYQMGLNCKNSSPEDLANSLFRIYEDENLRRDMGKNSRRLAEEKFDRERTYSEIFSLLG
jgi:glycosyltransferase involved in cell wall biosynthesis